jgi:hypothetical protein
LPVCDCGVCLAGDFKFCPLVHDSGLSRASAVRRLLALMDQARVQERNNWISKLGSGYGGFSIDQVATSQSFGSDVDMGVVQNHAILVVCE